MEFRDRLFALIHGLPVADEPVTHLKSGPSEPGAFEKFREQMELDHLMGNSSNSSTDYLHPAGSLHRAGVGTGE